jgi:uncharacterized protein YrzB (UPF0473 family)
MDEKIISLEIEGETVSFEIVEDFKLNGQRYLLVVEISNNSDEDSDEEAFILKEVPNEAGEPTYNFLEDDNELSIISDYLNAVFEDLKIDY